jgi:hypothetical protein
MPVAVASVSNIKVVDDVATMLGFAPPPPRLFHVPTTVPAGAVLILTGNVIVKPVLDPFDAYPARKMS